MAANQCHVRQHMVAQDRAGQGASIRCCHKVVSQQQACYANEPFKEIVPLPNHLCKRLSIADSLTWMGDRSKVTRTEGMWSERKVWLQARQGGTGQAHIRGYL
jgi:hypothetical protein